jgi:chromosomal replication initiator protein
MSGRGVMVADIKRAVALEFKVPLSVMCEPDGARGSRLRDRARPRQVAMFFSRRLTSHSSVRIGHFFGQRDHATVLNACKQVEERWRADPELRGKMQRAFAEIGR